MLDCWAQMLRLQSNMQRASAIVCKSMQGEIPPVKDNSPALYTIVEPCSFYKKNIKKKFLQDAHIFKVCFHLLGEIVSPKNICNDFLLDPGPFVVSPCLSFCHSGMFLKLD